MVERELLADYPDEEMGFVPMHHVVPRLLGTPGSISIARAMARAAQPRDPERVGIEGRCLSTQLLDAGVVSEAAAAEGTPSG